MTQRAYLTLAAIGLVLSVIMMVLRETPGYTDAYYYYNAGAKFADGDGLTDAYLWNYVNAPDNLPTESHRYWMPLASLVAALPMFILGTEFWVAQVAFVPFYIGLACLGMWLGAKFGKKRHGWLSGLSILFGGLYLPFYLTTDTFVLFGFLGSVALISLGMGRESGNWRWYVLAGVCGGLAHWARADGLLFVLVGIIVIWWPKPHPLPASREGGKNSITLILAYFITMLPLFMRNMSAFGALLPSGGLGTIFLKGYNDLFSYPAEWSVREFLDWGAGNIIQSRIEGITGALATWIAVEGFVFLTPLAVWTLWKRRREGFFSGVIWYAIGLHLAMSVVFTYPGIRGGLFHSSAALLPFWTAFGFIGLDEAITILGRFRKWKNIRQAQTVFGTAAVFLPLVLGLSAWSQQADGWEHIPNYADVVENLPPDARLMVNDPAEWHYYTGRIGVTLPDESLDTAYQIAQKYCIQYLIIDENVTDAFVPLYEGRIDPPAFLTRLQSEGFQVYEFDLDCTP